MKALISGCMLGAFIGGSVLGWVVAANGYEKEIVRLEDVAFEAGVHARGFQAMKACVSDVTPVRADLIGALGEARKFHLCTVDVVQMTEEIVTPRAGVAELAYAPVSKTGPERVAGSTPAPGTSHRKAGR